MQLENKKIIVTGGTKGIGAATVKLYVKEGAQVVFCGTNDARGKATEDAVNAIGPGHATYMRCNIASKEEADAFFARLWRFWVVWIFWPTWLVWRPT